ncbi:insulin receptor substrate 1-B isoform X1 [Scleropages formosus]|uniref:Insulin receptor substrate 1-B-like n=1 Tax=Scleropages formosus TaxID=113540 RepID=A0A8C9VZ92_SCLFO|nr:insulin receptor substrate 1-B-like isoform X1 [Scleropages formosus]
METQAPEQQSFQDVRMCGYLRKPKSAHRRFFVLRAASARGPARIEYYENEKKFRSKAPVPKKALSLETCFNINKRADSKNRHMIVLYTRGESFAIAADSEQLQEQWYQAMLELQCGSKTPSEGSGGDVPSPGPAFKEVWQVKVWPKGLGQARNLVGIYRLCLTDKTVSFVKLNSDAAAVVLQLMNVRRCGHSENFFFVEVGRSAVTGPGEFWMQVEDSVVAQNMHETLLEAMKALSEEFCQRSKSQSVGALAGGGNPSNPISVPSRRHYPNPPPSQVGFTRRPRTETPGTGGGSSTNTSPTPRHGFSRARTASVGAGTEEGMVAAGGPGLGASLNLNQGGSCSTTPNLRLKSRAPTPAKIHLSLACYGSNPGASPAPSLSSSSGHGSECGLVGGVGLAGVCAYGRYAPQRVSASGSPSDYGSSDEDGCSIAESTLLTPDLPGASAGGLGFHSALEEASNYIAMGQRSGQHTRRLLRRSSSRECEPERRLHSKRASLPPTALEQPITGRTDEEDGERETYTLMSRSLSRESFTSCRDSGSITTVTGGYLDMTGEVMPKDSGREGPQGGTMVDNGYMTMLPGVTSPPASLSLSLSPAASDPKPGSGDDYMAMTPNSSVSPPRHIRSAGSEGYMVMSPNSGCSPEQHGLGTLGGRWGSRRSLAGDYMNMSPISPRSADGTPPQHLGQHLQQTPPKMVYSCCSLPRSYKHTLSASFQDELGQGTRDGCRGSVTQVEGGKATGRPVRQEPSEGAKDSQHLSLSSSSFSSSSASSESLEEKLVEPRGLKVRPGLAFGIGRETFKEGVSQQRCAPVVPKQGPPQPRRGRPTSLFEHISKASTLPRVRENTLLPITPSPGEYVSIEYRGDVAGGPGRGLTHSSSGAFHRPAPSMAGSLTLPRSMSAPLSPLVTAEYVNMELGPTPASSPLSPTPLGFRSGKSPLSLMAVAPKARYEHQVGPQEAEVADAGYGKSGGVPAALTPELASSCEYTEMAFSVGATVPSECANTGPSKVRTTHASSMELGGDFLPADSDTGVEQSTKTMRADPTTRRRHCSETFLALSSASSPAVFPKHGQVGVRRQGLEGVLWGNGTASDSPRISVRPPPPPIPSVQAASMEQGLNYIDLDLVSKESARSGLEGPAASQLLPPRLFASVLAGGLGGCVGAGSGLNTYASIDFFKSEELRTHQNGSKDGTEC